MRIAFDAKRLFNNFTGLGNYSRTLLNDLAQSDSDTKWFLCADRLQQNERTVPFFNKVDYQLIQPPKNKLLWRQFGIVEDLKQNRIQLYHGLSNELPLGLRAAGIKQIVTIHDLLFYQFKEDFPWFDRQIYDWKFSSACGKADKIIAISEHTKSEIVDKYGIEPNKIEVIYQSCDTQFFRPVAEEAMNR
ncbi:MAG: glycosyltransferase, partial [Saprospiraceae bacterium]